MPVVLRAFRSTDIPSMYLLSDSIGWTQRLEDWRWLTSLARGVVATQDGALVGASMCWDYDNAVSSIGAVMVDPELQGMGIGRKLLDSCMRTLHQRTVILHATPVGRPLYEKLGFRAKGELFQHEGVARLEIPPSRPDGEIQPLSGKFVESAVRLAELGSGLRRVPLLTSLIRRSEGVVVVREDQPVGFSLMRRYAKGLAIGPVISASEADAREMISHWLRRAAGRFVRIDLTSQSSLDFRLWLESAGLPCASSATPMVRGIWPETDPKFAQLAVVTQATG